MLPKQLSFRKLLAPFLPPRLSSNLLGSENALFELQYTVILFLIDLKVNHKTKKNYG